MNQEGRRKTGNKRQQAYRRGQYAETIAAWALRLKGFRIVARRYKTKQGEVDIIARRGHLVVMVEVKARKSLTDAQEAVTQSAWLRIEAAGDHWLARQSDFARLSIRYDLVAVLPGRWPVHVQAVYTGK